MLFHKITPDQVEKYHQIFYLKGVAGGYAISKSGRIILKKIEGCYYNLLGLPINTTSDLLYKAGIDLWDYLQFN